MGARALIVLCSIVLISCGVSKNSFDFDLFEANASLDNERIQYYIDTMNYEYFQAELSENWTKVEMDKMIEENKFGLTDGIVRYAPDNTFRIFCLEGEQCGAYCNPLYETVLEFANPNIPDDFINTPTITAITQVTDTTYLLNGRGYARPSSFYSVEIEMLHYLVVTTDTAYFIPFPEIEIGEFDPTGGFLMFQEYFLEDIMIKDYNSETKQVYYEYRRNYEADYNEDIDSLFTGKFQLGGEKIIWLENNSTQVIAKKIEGW